MAAPGDGILSTVPTWYFGPGSLPYRRFDGTSYRRAPCRPGWPPSSRARSPGSRPPNIMDIIRFSADDINADTLPGNDESIGYGRINMEKALVPLILENDIP